MKKAAKESPQRIKATFVRIGDCGPLPLPVVLYADGTALTLTTEKDAPSLEELQGAVGGYIEVVQIPAMRGVLMIVDEEGRMKGKAVNAIASEIAGTEIVGDVVITLDEDDE